MENAIIVNNLTKTYRIPQREPGLKSAFRSLIKPAFMDIPAVQSISFTIQPGEIIGFIGPNGAGKTTTLKMLSGLLYPTSGEILVSGYTPWKRQENFLRSISMVLGNKSQMLWDISPLDTYAVLAEIYRISPSDLHKRLDELVNLLDMQELLKKPVRNLSLGERMKCELTAGLLHRPSVLFLDEPTLGLDISMQKRLRCFIAEYNRKYAATILLTSHYMADVTALCNRVILIHNGHILYDGALQSLAEQLAPYKLIRLTLEDGLSPQTIAEILPTDVTILESQGQQVLLRVDRQKTPAVTALILNRMAVADLSVEDPPLEAVIDRVYREAQS